MSDVTERIKVCKLTEPEDLSKSEKSRRDSVNKVFTVKKI